MPATCRCQVSDWRALRHALSLSQTRFAELLGCDRTLVVRLEGPGHHCPGGPVVRVLRFLLDDVEARRRLNQAGIPLPERPPLLPSEASLAYLARRFGVSRATLCRDWAAIMAGDIRRRCKV